MMMPDHDVADAFKAGGWEFTPEVVREFDEHVRQSVPFYDAIQDIVAELSDWLAPAGSLVVDLGCATGESLRRIAERHPDRDLAFTGYDTSPHMLAAAAMKVPTLATFENDIRNGLCHQDAALTLALFTLQFIPPEARQHVLRQALVASRQGTAAILVAEKVRVPDSRWFEIGAELSWDWKADHGIPSESIRSKARALRGVLRPLTEDDNLDLLEAAGWQQPTCLFRWHQWAVFGAFA